MYGSLTLRTHHEAGRTLALTSRPVVRRYHASHAACSIGTTNGRTEVPILIVAQLLWASNRIRKKGPYLLEHLFPIYSYLRTFFAFVFFVFCKQFNSPFKKGRSPRISKTVRQIEMRHQMNRPHQWCTDENVLRLTDRDYIGMHYLLVL